jgi:peptidyl-prolyl cis-trans isomerase C
MRIPSTLALALAASLAGTAAFAQDAAKGKAAPKAAPKAEAPATPNVPINQAHFDLLLKERIGSGQPDSPQLREAIREELVTREIVVREAKRKGLDKNPDLKAQMELTQQTVLVRATIGEHLRANPITDEQLHKDYDAFKSQMGEKEYRVRHVLVDKEDEAKEVVALLQKGEKFDALASARSKDAGSKERGGELDWAVPSAYVKPFADAMVKLEKGKFTPVPVQSPFGWHVILLEDVRDAKLPSFEELKPQLMQRAQGEAVQKYITDLRAKAK